MRQSAHIFLGAIYFSDIMAWSPIAFKPHDSCAYRNHAATCRDVMLPLLSVPGARSRFNQHFNDPISSVPADVGSKHLHGDLEDVTEEVPFSILA